MDGQEIPNLIYFQAEVHLSSKTEVLDNSNPPKKDLIIRNTEFVFREMSK